MHHAQAQRRCILPRVTKDQEMGNKDSRERTRKKEERNQGEREEAFDWRGQVGTGKRGQRG